MSAFTALQSLRHVDGLIRNPSERRTRSTSVDGALLFAARISATLPAASIDAFLGFPLSDLPALRRASRPPFR